MKHERERIQGVLATSLLVVFAVVITAVIWALLGR